MPGSQAAVRVASARKEKFTSPSWGGPDVIIDRFSGLFALFEADGMSDFPLAEHGAIDGHAISCHAGTIFNLQADPSQPQLPVDG